MKSQSLHITSEFESLDIFRLTPKNITLSEHVGDERTFAVIDLETTGYGKDAEIIELGAVKVQYSPSTRRITSINVGLSLLEQPSEPILVEAMEIHGITDEEVEGKMFDDSKVLSFFDDIEFVVSHNTSDRPLFDCRFPELCALPWACSSIDIPWRKYGFSTCVLELLGFKNGFTFEAHRAPHDAFAVAVLLTTDNKYFQHILDAITNVMYRICAFGSPYEVKDLLNSRGYVWDDTNTGFGYWSITVLSEKAKDDELDFLEDTYGGFNSASICLVDATTRFK